MYKQYDVVKILKLNRAFNPGGNWVGKKVPKVGDIATIVEVYKNPKLGYELECVNEDANTEWLVTFDPNDAVFQLVKNGDR